jgi:hypothetical protein
MCIKRTFIAAVLCFVSIVQFAGCKMAQVAFPEGSDKAVFDQFDVQGRRDFALFSGKYKFGPYTVDWTRGAVFSKPSEEKGFLGDEDTTTSTETYTISLSGNDGVSWNGECKSKAEFIKETKASKKVTTTTTQIISNTLVSKLISSDKQTIELKISQDTGFNGKKQGTVQGKNISLEIKATHRLEGAAWDINYAAGYYITESGTLVAVVDVTNEGKVYIIKGLKKDKTQILAAVSSVLLAYKDVLN